MAASALLKSTVSIEEWLATTTFVQRRNSNLQGKIVFLGTTTLDHSLFL